MALGAVTLLLAACSTVAPGTLPSAVPSTPYPSVLGPAPATPAAPTPAPTPTPRAYHLGSAGDVVLATTSEAALGRGLVVVVTAITPETGASRTVARTFVLPKGWSRYADQGAAISADGTRIALELAADDEQTPGVAIVALGDDSTEGAAVPVLPGASPTWLPDGSLVLYSGGTAEEPGRLDRYEPGADAPSATLTETGGRSFYRIPGVFVMAADGSGVVGSTIDDAGTETQAVFGWDGSETPRQAGTAPLFNTGTERPDAAGGATSFSFCDESPTGGVCGNTWKRADGSMARIITSRGQVAQWSAWTRDGSTLVLLDTAVRVAHDSGGSTVPSTLVARLPASQMGWNLVGLTDTTAVVSESAAGWTYLVDLVQESLGGPVQGAFAGVLR